MTNYTKRREINIKKKLLKLFPIAVVVIILAVFARTQYEDYMYKKNFKPNRWNQPYSRGVPLEEMDFSRYSTYILVTCSENSNTNRNSVILPCDVEYYRSKNDKEPVLTIKKGTTVYARNVKGEIVFGYGLTCWPDYNSKWRYGRPFSTSEFSDVSGEPMYFVNSKQLTSVAKSCYKLDKEWYSSQGISMSSSLYVKNTTRAIDSFLYHNGVFCAPHK